MKLNGFYKFQASKEQIFAALLDPKQLEATIPACDSAWYSNTWGHIEVSIKTPVPGLEGPYVISVKVLEKHEPDMLVLSAGRNGTIGGKVNTVTRISLTDEADGTMLTYETTAELSGPIAAANNPLFQGIAKHSLKTFFKNLDASLVQGSTVK